MGNRAVITTKDNFFNNGIGIYVHWKGDRESVQRWLDLCSYKGYRKPEDDPYGWAYLCKEIADYFNDGMSVGMGVVSQLDCNNWDNGTWFIKDWKIVGNRNIYGIGKPGYNFDDEPDK